MTAGPRLTATFSLNAAITTSGSDGDSVTDDLDRCPNNPRGVKVDARGCPLDTDGDGVPDYLDECPDTPKGAKVNQRGCWVLVDEEVRLQKGNVLFDFGKSDIKPQAYSH